MTGCSGSVFLGIMYIEWYVVCNFVRLLEYGLIMVVCMCFMFVLICALFMV